MLSSPGSTGRPSIPERRLWSRDLSEYWFPAIAGMTPGCCGSSELSRFALASYPLQRLVRCVAMIRRDVGCDHPDRGGEHRGIVGEAEHRQHVGHEVERQDE